MCRSLLLDAGVRSSLIKVGWTQTLWGPVIPFIQCHSSLILCLEILLRMCCTSARIKGWVLELESNSHGSTAVLRKRRPLLGNVTALTQTPGWSLAGIALAVRVEESGIAPPDALGTLLGGCSPAKARQVKLGWFSCWARLKFTLSIVDVDGVFLVLFKVWIFISFLKCLQLVFGASNPASIPGASSHSLLLEIWGPSVATAQGTQSSKPGATDRRRLSDGMQVLTKWLMQVTPQAVFNLTLRREWFSPKWVSFLWIIAHYFTLF